MKRSLLLLLPLFAALAISSCKRGDDSGLTKVTPGGYTTLDGIFERVQRDALFPTTQAIKVSSGGDIFSSRGTHVFIPKDAFQSYSGAVVTGSVDVKIVDWVNKGDMVFGKVLPVSNNQPLATSGQIYIEATQNGVPVRLRKGFYAYVLFPQFGATFTPGDSLYLGQQVAGSSNIVNWYARDTAGRTAQFGTDSVALRTDSLRYIAASHFLPVSGYSNFTVRLNTPVELEQTLAVALMDNVKSVYPVSSAVNGIVSAQRVPAAPLHLAVMGVNKGVFYAGITAISNPATDSSYQVIIKQIDPQTFRLQMNALQ